MYLNGRPPCLAHNLSILLFFKKNSKTRLKQQQQKQKQKTDRKMSR